MAQVHNNQRDGMHRQAIHRGRVAYEPNSPGGGCPHQAGMRGFVSFAEPLESREHKVRGKPERFADHYLEFLEDQYRHCKPILVLGESTQLLEKAGIPRTLASGEEDEALIVAEAPGAEAAIQRIIAAIARHRNFARDSDPPPV